VGRLLVIEGRSLEITTIGVPRDPGCAVCGASAPQ
jgi:hypothetical protein